MTDRSSRSGRYPAHGAPVPGATPRPALGAAVRLLAPALLASSLFAASLLAACATTVPRYDYRPPGVRLEARGLAQGDVVLRPGSRAVERELGAGEGVELAVVATDGGGVRRVALVGRVTVGCWNPDTGAQTLDVTEVAHENEVAAGPGGTVRTSAQVSRIFRVSDYRVTCSGTATTPWVEGTFHGEAEDFHGRWTATGSFTFWFGVEGGSRAAPAMAPPVAARIIPGR